MNDRNKYKSNYQDLKCIWMASDLVDYKLCDRDFDCENCQFDKVMRNLSSRSTGKIEFSAEPFEKIDKILNDLKKDGNKSNLIYLKNNLVLKHLFAKTYYIGLSSVILTFLDNINSVEHLSEENHIEPDDGILRITGNWGTVVIKSPIKYTALENLNVNSAFQSGHKWFALIEISPEEVTAKKLSHNKWLTEQTGIIDLLNEYKINIPFVGFTMQDGGEPIKYFHQLIGKDEYKRIVEKLAGK